MSITVCKTPDAYFEGLWAVQALCCGEGPRALAERIAAKHPTQAENIRALFTPLFAVQDALETAIDVSDADVRFLFGPQDELGYPLCTLFQLPERYGVPDGDLIRKLFASFLLQLQLQDDAEFAFPSDEALSAYIRALPHSMAAKSALLYVFFNYRDLLEFAKRTAARAMAVIESRGAEAGPLIAAAARFWDERATGTAGLRAAFEELELPIALDGGSFTLYPSLFRPTGLTILEYDGEVRIYYGVRMAESARWARQGGFSPERLQETLKLLSDKTKLEILRLLRTERLYGSQLAERLDLTAATISYHLSQLASQGLIRLVKEGGRYYCEPERDAISAFLAALQERLPH